ncbi:MAG: aminomethyl-transferring glycine dehydrogenase subunit GcvPB [candidate division WOR-3 bacterium]|nr:aminomethyl-transferring glycine dehydrogenase subunit GcvPB [candidate division WOR-3 bacterium]
MMSNFEPLIFEYSRSNRKGYSLPKLDVSFNIDDIPEEELRKDLNLPEVSEVDVVRHFVKLSVLNHHVDKGFYPLGSCTMKYNPKINEDIANLDGFSFIHPLQPEDTVQGALMLMYELGQFLCEISGMDAISLQPAAGAQGELTSIMIARKYFEEHGEARKKVLIPDSAHGTNPASVNLAGFTAVEIKSNEQGMVDLTDLTTKLDYNVACLMLTVPNTLGIFDQELSKIINLVHSKGALVYLDGANMNAYLGYFRPGDAGFDFVHFNLHKTFSTPHGGGGPGSGPVGVKEYLAKYLPVPVIKKHFTSSGEEHYSLIFDVPASIGKVLAFYGNFLVMVKAYSYIRMLGAKGLKEVAEIAIINANYIRKSLEEYYHLPYKNICMHECVFSSINFREYGVRALDIAKRLLDYGLHAPTIYFPLIVPEALMIEPTETESKETIDRFIQAMIEIAHEARENPQLLKEAPWKTPVRRLDEVRASRELNIRFIRH